MRGSVELKSNKQWVASAIILFAQPLSSPELEHLQVANISFAISNKAGYVSTILQSHGSRSWYIEPKLNNAFYQTPFSCAQKGLGMRVFNTHSHLSTPKLGGGQDTDSPILSSSPSNLDVSATL